jgi:hypothetical protein
MYKLFVVNLMSEDENKMLTCLAQRWHLKGFVPVCLRKCRVSSSDLHTNLAVRYRTYIGTNNIMIIFKGIKIFILYFLRKKRKVALVQP